MFADDINSDDTYQENYNDNASCCTSPVKTYIQFRSTGANTARELVGWQWELNRAFMCENYGSFYIAYEYQNSFKPETITNQLFGGSSLYFSGSQVPDRSPCELLADNFGLSQDFVGSVSFCPEIINNTVDLGFYLGLDSWLQNSYIRIQMPITNTLWKLNACANTDQTSPEILPCYVNSASHNSLFSDVSQTPAIQDLQEALLGITQFGDKKESWCSSRIDFCRRVKTGLADIDFIFGYNIFNTDCYHLGLYGQAVLPTGGKPKSLYLFNPVVGNGGHFELGAGVSAHGVLWSCENQNLAVFLEGNITHMFQNQQCRAFDFCKNGAFSRYMLLKEFDSNGVVNTYDGNLVSATCFTNRLANVTIDVKGDASIKLAYRYGGWGADIGYNAYGHTREKIDLLCTTDCCNADRKLAVKGTEGVCCSQYSILAQTDVQPNILLIAPNETPVNTGIPGGFSVPNGCPALEDNVATVKKVINSATQPNATAYEGAPQTGSNSAVYTCNTVSGTDPSQTQCCNVALAYDSKDVDNPVIVGSINPVTGPSSAKTISNNLESQGYTLCHNSNPIDFLTENDLNISSGEALAVFTQKIFVHFNYMCYDESCWNPHFGIGGEVEFAGNKPSNYYGRPTSLNQWGIWAKGGVSF